MNLEPKTKLMFGNCEVIETLYNIKHRKKPVQDLVKNMRLKANESRNVIYDRGIKMGNHQIINIYQAANLHEI